MAAETAIIMERLVYLPWLGGLTWCILASCNYMAKAKTLPQRPRPRGCCSCMLCSHSRCHMAHCHFLFRIRDASKSCMWITNPSLWTASCCL